MRDHMRRCNVPDGACRTAPEPDAAQTRLLIEMVFVLELLVEGAIEWILTWWRHVRLPSSRECT